MSTVPVITPPPPHKRISTWIGATAAAAGAAALGSPEVTQAIIDTATRYAGDNAVGISLFAFGAQQAIFASRRWLQARAKKGR